MRATSHLGYAVLAASVVLSCRKHGTQIAPASSNASIASPSSRSWVNIGLSDARIDGAPYPESGRVMAIRVDPRDSEVVYIATVGGVWKTRDFSAAAPAWTLVTDALGTSAFSAVDLDPHAPDHLFVGSGDPHAIAQPGGGAVARSDDGGATWSKPVPLEGKDAHGRIARATSVRDVVVDPSDASHVLAAADCGLFRSTDGGKHFELVDLPNGSAAFQDEMWSIAYVGGSVWAASGLEECGARAQFAAPPSEDAPPPPCNSPQLGDIWRSEDGGATWTSARAQGKMPLHERTGIGRITLAAGDTSRPGSTAVFAMVSSDPPFSTVDVFRSTDGARTFVSARGTLRNGNRACSSMDLGGPQSNYNQAAAVDPTDPRRVFLGGMLCGYQSRDALSAGPSWDVATQGWLQKSALFASCHPAVHSDFHTARIVASGAAVTLLVGNDGGVHAAASPFAEDPCKVAWRHPNGGLPNQLVTSVASGDPATGDADVVFAGMQDNGTRVREAGGSSVWDIASFSDGHGEAIGHTADGAGIWWMGNGPLRSYCKPRESDCRKRRSWSSAPSLSLDPGDAPSAWLTAPIPADGTGAVLAGTVHNVFRLEASPKWVKLTSAPLPSAIIRVVAAPATTGLYGAVLADGRCAVSPERDGAPWDVSAHVAGANSSRGLPLGMAFPSVLPAGAHPGDTYLCGHAPQSADEATLYITSDRGATFAPLHGKPGAELPKLPILAVAYDTHDTTGRTILVGNTAGLFFSSDGGATWARTGKELPVVPVTDIFVSKRGELVRIGTWGRGVWEETR